MSAAYAATVRAVQFDMADPEFPASLVDLPEPDLPGSSWARIAVTTGGICGSDLHLFAHNTGPSPTLAAMGALPFVLGHEIGGRIVETGADCPPSTPASRASLAASNRCAPTAPAAGPLRV
jgi:threonine dehydrogenase-like Zn-dependent dehydrogenase